MSALQRRQFNERIFDIVEGLEPLARGHDATVSQIALAWVMGQPGVTSPIIGPRTTEQLEDNLAAADVELTEDDRHAIDRLVPPGHHVAPYYEADFGPHRFRV